MRTMLRLIAILLVITAILLSAPGLVVLVVLLPFGGLVFLLLALAAGIFLLVPSIVLVAVAAVLEDRSP